MAHTSQKTKHGRMGGLGRPSLESKRLEPPTPDAAVGVDARAAHRLGAAEAAARGGRGVAAVRLGRYRLDREQAAQPAPGGAEQVPAGSLNRWGRFGQGTRLDGGRGGDQQHCNQGDGEEGAGKHAVHDVLSSQTNFISMRAGAWHVAAPPTITTNCRTRFNALSVTPKTNRDTGMTESHLDPRNSAHKGDETSVGARAVPSGGQPTAVLLGLPELRESPEILLKKRYKG